MKRFFTLTLVFLCLFFSFTTVISLAQPTSNLIKEGIYNVSDLGLSLDQIYSIQNTSNDKMAFVMLFDDHDELLQFIKLTPGSLKQKLLPMKVNYRIIVVGTTEVFFSKPET